MTEVLRDRNGLEILAGDVLAFEGTPYFRIRGDGSYERHDTGDVCDDGRPIRYATGWKGYEIVRRADGTDPRLSKEQEGCMPVVTTALPPYERKVTGVQTAPAPKPPQRQPHELYAEFRRVVEETVAMEAPKVRVVTDFKDTSGLAWFSFGAVRSQMGYDLRNDRLWANDTVWCLKNLRFQLHANDPLK